MSSDSLSTASTAPKGVRQVAVVDIGSTSVRLAVGEISATGDVRTLETLSQAVDLGKDTFTSGAISKETIEDCVRALKSYGRILREYGIVAAENIRVVATSAVREATNRLAFIDRVYIATGLQVEPLEEAEVNRITFLGVQPELRVASPSDRAAMIVEVGGGSTEVIVVRGGDVVFAHSYRLGAVRLRKQLEGWRTPSGKVRSLMETHIRRTIEQIAREAPRDVPVELIALGGDARFAGHLLEEEWNQEDPLKVATARLTKLASQIVDLSDDDLVRVYGRKGLTYQDAEPLAPALLACVTLAEELKLKEVTISSANLRDGLLKEMARRSGWSGDFNRQIIRAAIGLGRRFAFDEKHAVHVADLAKLLFAQLRDEHRLSERHETILYVAALLHEIGLYVSARSHHKHSMYLIRNAELFGLARKDQLLAALVARYHRRASPQPTHEGYNTLDRDERVAVAKMAALLRVAIALDDSRSQRIHDLRCAMEGGRLTITIPMVEDLSLEQLALRQNAGLFEEVFGVSVLLRMSRR